MASKIHIQKETQLLIQVFESKLQHPQSREIQVVLKKHSWIPGFVQSMKSQAMISVQEMGDKEKRQRSSCCKRNLQHLQHSLNHAYRKCRTRRENERLPEWMLWNAKKESFIDFFERFFEELWNFDDKVIAYLARHIPQGLYGYFDDFCEYKALKTPNDSYEDYLRLCEAHKCLKANVVLFGLSQKGLKELLRL